MKAAISSALAQTDVEAALDYYYRQARAAGGFIGALEQAIADIQTLQVSEAAIAELAKVGFDPVFGARPLKRAIQQRIENPLSKLLLEGRFPPKSTIPVDVDPIQNPGVFSFDQGGQYG